MSTAEKLQTIAENEQKVYKAGYDKGVYETEIWDALAGNPEFKLDKFRRSDVVINLSQFISNVRYFSSLTANYANTTLKHLTINCPNKVTHAFSFVTAQRDNCITHLTINIDVSLVTNFSGFIRYLETVEIIDGTPLNWSSATSGTLQNFNRCFKLREIRFVAESLPLQMFFGESPELSDESINSIINGLMYLETTQTIKFHNTVGKKLTDEQKSVIALKGWTLAY